MTQHEKWALLVLAGLVLVAFGWLLGHWRPWGRLLDWIWPAPCERIWRHGRRAGQSEGYERGRHDFDRVPEPEPVTEIIEGRPWPAVMANPPDATHDFLHPDWEQLAPEHIQDLPGPDPSSTASRAGGLHWWEEPPLPAVLGLGPEFSGDDKTFARWQVRRWEFRRQCGLPALEAA